MGQLVTETNDQNFHSDVLKSDLPVVVDFYASWCVPCQQLMPHFNDLANKYGGKIKTIKLNVENNHKIPNMYSVMGVPNVMFFRSGKVVDQLIGGVTPEKIEERIKTII